MIVRIVRGRLRSDALEPVRAELERRRITARSQPGLVRSHIAARELDEQSGHPGDLELLALDFWTTAEGTTAEGDEPVVVTALGEILQEPETALFEVDEMLLRGSSTDVKVIRTAIGRFSKPGADIEMQDLLRQRVPSVGAELIESYVGRRLVGRAVDVAFISTWADEPRGRPLDEPFWPDISLRYDEFDVAVYVPLSRTPRRRG